MASGVNIFMAPSVAFLVDITARAPPQFIPETGTCGDQATDVLVSSDFVLSFVS